MRRNSPDIVDAVLAAAGAALGLPEARFEAIEAKVRREWGAARHYIRGVDKKGRVREAVAKVRAGASVREASRQCGVSRESVCRLLRKRGR